MLPLFLAEFVNTASIFVAEFVNTASNFLFLLMPPLLMRLHQPYANRCGKGNAQSYGTVYIKQRCFHVLNQLGLASAQPTAVHNLSLI